MTLHSRYTMTTGDQKI